MGPVVVAHRPYYPGIVHAPPNHAAPVHISRTRNTREPHALRSQPSTNAQCVRPSGPVCQSFGGPSFVHNRDGSATTSAAQLQHLESTRAARSRACSSMSILTPISQNIQIEPAARLARLLFVAFSDASITGLSF